MTRRPHPFPIILAACAAISLALPSPASPVSWSVDSDGLWTTPSNWSTHSLPTSSDDVTLNRGPLGAYTITLNAGSQSIQSLSSNDNLSLTGGTLSLSSPSTINASFSLTGGTVTGTGVLTLAGPATLTQGYILGSSPLSFSPTAVVSAGGASDAYLSRPILNAGTLNLTAGPAFNTFQLLPAFTNLPGASINKTGTAAASLTNDLQNDGTVNIHQGTLTLYSFDAPPSTGNINVDAGATLSFIGTLSPAASIAGAGSALLSRATINGSYSLTDTTVAASPFNNQPGTITFNGPATSTGTLTVTGSNSYPGSAVFNANATIGSLSLQATTPSSLAGSITFNAPASIGSLSLANPLSTVTFNSPSTLSSLSFSAGTLAGSGSVTLGPSNFSWTTGSFAGSGHLVISPSSSFTFANLNTTLSKPLDNYGSLTDLTTTSATSLLLNAVSLYNAPGGTYTLNTTTVDAAASPASLINAGTLAHPSIYSSTVKLPVTNTGLISATAGTLDLYSLSNTGTLAASHSTINVSSLSQMSGTTLNAGTYIASDNGHIVLPGTIYTLGPAVSVSISNQSSISLSHLQNLQGSLSLSGGYFTVPTAFVNTGSLTIGYAQSLAINGTFRNSGSFSNSGTLIFTSPNVAPFIWDYTNQPSPIDSLRAQLHTGYNNGNWYGTGITSTVAQKDAAHLTAIAYADASTLPPSTASNLNGGSPPSPATLLTLLTSYGDINLDGKLNADDYALLDRSYARHLPNPHWTDGDFNYDGAVDQADYLLIDKTLFSQAQGLSPGFLSERETQFGQAYVNALLASVPEPSCLSIGFVAAFPFLSRRRSTSPHPLI